MKGKAKIISNVLMLLVTAALSIHVVISYLNAR